MSKTPDEIASQLYYRNCDHPSHRFREAIASAITEERARATAAEAERDRLREALTDARDNGLIYWEPRTERGHVAKAEMLVRIASALARAKEPQP